MSVSNRKYEGVFENWPEEKKANYRARYAEGWPSKTLAMKAGVSESAMWSLVSDVPCKVTRLEKAAMGARRRHSASQASPTRFATTAHVIED